MNLKDELLEYVNKKIIPQYEYFDKGHRRDHVNYVIVESLRLADYYNVRQDMAYVIAAYHDLGLSAGREIHHLASGKIIRDDKNLRFWFNKNEIEVMAQAVEDHRASSSTPPRSIYGCIVAEADRQIDIDAILKRTIQYGLAHYPNLDEQEQIERAISHLDEKYGMNGYVKLFLEASSNAQKLEKLQDLMNDKSLVKKMIKEILKTEIKNKLT